MNIFSTRIARASVLAVAFGAAAVPVFAPAAPTKASTTASSLTVTCGAFNAGPSAVQAICWGSGGVALTVVCTNGTSWGFAFAPATITVACPAGGTVLRWTVG
jgi:hypothetical protein